MPRIVLTSTIAAPARTCFELSLSVDAHTASMAGSGERIVAGVSTGVMGLGDTVTWRARHFGLPFTMTSEITEYDAPHRFVDEQVTGPFKRWWHEHTFEERAGTTTMTDHVEFASPWGPLGKTVDALVLTRYLTRLLTRRNEWLVQALS
ncbi:MAG TPA: SRPBCC family protein [Marmoricola sp.]|nr:SRPBCC family protein [Marmoricola sp.]